MSESHFPWKRWLACGWVSWRLRWWFLASHYSRISCLCLSFPVRDWFSSRKPWKQWLSTTSTPPLRMSSAFGAPRPWRWAFHRGCCMESHGTGNALLQNQFKSTIFRKDIMEKYMIGSWARLVEGLLSNSCIRLIDWLIGLAVWVQEELHWSAMFTFFHGLIAICAIDLLNFSDSQYGWWSELVSSRTRRQGRPHSQQLHWHGASLVRIFFLCSERWITNRLWECHQKFVTDVFVLHYINDPCSLHCV